ncbi:MAG: hypothetical protein WA151_12365 [Desulfatirhabdiaceae bacterium]
MDIVSFPVNSSKYLWLEFISTGTKSKKQPERKYLFSGWCDDLIRTKNKSQMQTSQIEGFSTGFKTGVVGDEVPVGFLPEIQQVFLFCMGGV